MSIHTLFKSVTSSPTSRRPIRRIPPASRLNLESLEDRCLLSFSPAVNYPAGLNAHALLTADLNGDGRLDLAVLNYSSNTVSVLLRNANGTFQAPQNFATGAGPQSVAVGDFNADGKLDLVTANLAELSVLLGNGAGVLQEPTNINIGSNPSSVAVGDFNADGKLDLGVTSNVYSPGYYGGYGWYPGHYVGIANVLIGNGAGSFSTPNATSLGEGLRTTAVVADFNNDGKPDFATAAADYGSVTVSFGNGAGTLGNPIYSNGPLSQSMTAADLNNDGKLDLLMANTIGNSVSVLLGSGLGAFSYVSAQIYTVGSAATSVAVADCNGDSKLDLVAADNGNNVNVLLGNGAGAFRPPVSVSEGAGATNPVGIAVGDFNGDGRTDVATANSTSSNVSVLLNDGIWPALDVPSITIGDVTVTEGNVGTVSANFTVTLSTAYSQAVTVHYATADNNATAAGSDYQATSGTLTFNPGGPLTQTVSVLVNGDRVAEDNESFFVVLTGSTNAVVAKAKGVGTILDDEPSVGLASGAFGPEGNTGTTAFTFLVTLSAVYDAPVTVNYATADLTPDDQYWIGPGATAGIDYTATSGTLTIPAGQTSGTITVLVTGDRIVEPDEVFYFKLSNPTNAHLGSSQDLGIIMDDEPRVSIGSAIALEGNTGTKAFTFTVTLSVTYDVPVTVTYATADGSATLAGGDYRAASGTLTFAAGQTSKNITVLVNGDRAAEPDETFYVNLTGATGAGIASGTGYGTIQDDEPHISINSVSLKEGNSGTKLMTFTVTLSARYDQTVTVNYRTYDDSAKVADKDYVAKSGTLTFAPGQTTKTFTVTINGDTKKEADESFYVLLSGASSNAQIDNAYGWGDILNDDGRGREVHRPRFAWAVHAAIYEFMSSCSKKDAW